MAQRARKTTPAIDAPASWKNEWLEGAILFLAVVLTYIPIWPAGFSWDDNLVITSNPAIIGPLGLREIWTTSAADICPLTLTTFWFEHALWGLNPLPYHLVNIVLHGLNAILLWRVLRAFAAPGAWLGAALWALHPVQVESAAWIAEMKNTESALFYLLAILFFARNLRQSDAPFWNRNFGLSLLFAALAMAAKSSTVVLPFVFLLCTWWVRQKLEWRAALRTAPAFAMALVTGLVSMATQRHFLAFDPHAADWIPSWPQRIALLGDAIWFYLGKLVWPYPLMTIYPRWQIDAGQWTSYLPTVAAIAVLAILWSFRRTWSRPWLFAYSYFLIALLPVLGLAVNTYFENSFVADHFQYLAAMGPLALICAGIAKLAERIAPASKLVLIGFGGAILLFLGVISCQRVSLYQNPEKLWANTARYNPDSWVAYNFLGLAASVDGKLDEAAKFYQRSIDLNPNYTAALFNLGQLFSQTGRANEAMDEFRKAIEVDPRFVDARYNYANGLYQAGRADDAMAEYQKVLEIDPTHSRAHNNLGFALFEKGRIDDAVAEFQTAIRIDPDFADAHYNLGLAFAQTHQLDDAIREFQEAVRLDPADTNAQANLAHAQALK